MRTHINLLDVKCFGCNHRFCCRCEMSSHFPASCEERKWWVDRHLVTDSFTSDEIVLTEDKLSGLECLLELVILKQSYIEEVFHHNPHLTGLLSIIIEEMKSMVNLLYWGSVICCSNGEFRWKLDFDLAAVRNAVNNLIFYFPSNGSEAVIQEFSRLRIHAVNAVLSYLSSLIWLRTDGAKEVHLVREMGELSDIFEPAGLTFPEAEDEEFDALCTALMIWKNVPYA